MTRYSPEERQRRKSYFRQMRVRSPYVKRRLAELGVDLRARPVGRPESRWRGTRLTPLQLQLQLWLTRP